MIDTSNARRNIMQRIRAAKARQAQQLNDDKAALEDYLAFHPRGPRSQLASDPLLEFCLRASELESSVAVVADRTAVPSAAASFLSSHTLSMRAVGTGAVASVDFAAAGMQVEIRAPRDSDLVGISRAFCGVAETGSLVFASGPMDSPTVNILPTTHIALLQSSRIVVSMEDAFDLMRRELGELPRAVNFISGPSRTADIEQTIVLGAHGPRALHVIVVEADL